jgi:hypothetical protein
MRRFSLLASRRTDQLEPLSRGDGRTEITADLPGYISVNAAGHRVDANIMQPPTQSCFDAYGEHKIRNGRVGSCYDFHVGDGCDGQECLCDHSAISDEILSVLLFKCQNTRCVDGGACRSFNCYFGHSCHWERCADTQSKCKFEDAELGVDQAVHHWEMGRLRNGSMG